jgi:ADP-L-glycero-D-manno-heptose 6-epimerase
MKGRKDLEALVHLGACSDTTVHDRAFMMEVNFEYSRGLWEVCAEQGIPFLYASSAATYGDGSAGYDDLTPPGDLRPLNVYGESKNLFDQWALSAGRQPPRWAGFKYFNVYGPGEGHKGRMASMAFHAYQQIRQSGRVRLFMSHREGIPHGGQRRDFVYVEDAVEATLHFLGLPVSGQAPNGLYNVGTGEARSFAELAGAVFSALDREPAIEFIPTPEDIRDKYQYFTQAKTGKLRAAGVVRPFHTIEEGVKKYMAFLEPGRPS